MDWVVSGVISLEGWGEFDKYILMSAERINERKGAQKVPKDETDNSQQGELPAPLEKKMTRNQKAAGTTVAVSILALVGYYFIKPSLQPDFLLLSQYEFKVYCPINKIPTATLGINEHDDFSLQDFMKDDLRVLSKEEADAQSGKQIDKYVIYVQIHPTLGKADPQHNVSNRYFYCSYVTDWTTRDCSKAQKVCSVPGPIFWIQKDQPIEVAWVYDIHRQESTAFPENIGCYTNETNKPLPVKCNLSSKRYQKDGCTYPGPINPINSSDPAQQLYDQTVVDENFTIGLDTVPLSVHIHGLEVRPVFDGNPLSWAGTNGVVGSGYATLINIGYFDQFDSSYPKSKFVLSNTTGPNYVKVNRYENFQPAGNLWYHDHAMHATNPNVKYGLAGSYIIHDSNVDVQLPKGDQEILIVAGLNFDLTDNKADDLPKTKMSKHHQKVAEAGANIDQNRGGKDVHTNPDIPLYTQTALAFKRGFTYRIRILNGQYDSIFTNLKFKTQCDDSQYPAINASTCKKTLDFTVIGSDSCLFKETVRSDRLSIASAERFELLLSIDATKKTVTENPIAIGSKYILLADQKDNVHNAFELMATKDRDPYPALAQAVQSLVGVSFYDLTGINQLCNANNPVSNPTLCLSNLRMRPFFRDANFKFFFNGHYSFSDSGRSDDPKIGTTEDWYFINTMSFIDHPIHVHLINYQIVAQTKLKFANDTSDDCSLYEADFYLKSGIIKAGNRTYVCQQVRKLDLSNQTTEYLMKNIYPQDGEDQQTLVSGLDVRQKFDRNNLTEYEFYGKNIDCPESEFKYICGDFSNQDIPLWYRKWKEVALVHSSMVLQVRIRWTKTDYDDKTDIDNKQDYFSVPEDQLIEHPGYVYHCHFLTHQDDELMRPIMMQPSDRFASKYSVDSSTDLGKCMATNGKNLSGGWKDRYQCINDNNNCTVTKAA